MFDRATGTQRFMLQSFPCLLKYSLLLLLTLTVSACGGGSSDVVRLSDEQTASQTSAPVDLKMNANVVKGPVAGAEVSVYEVDFTDSEFADVSRSAEYLFDLLYEQGVRYQNGVLVFNDASDSEVYSALVAQAQRDLFVGEILALKELVQGVTTVDAATTLLQTYADAETNPAFRTQIENVLSGFATLEDLKQRVSDIETPVTELKEDFADSDQRLSFSQVTSVVQSFASGEEDSVKASGWTEFLQSVESLRLSSASLGDVRRSLSAILEQGDDSGWFISDLIGRQNLVALIDDIEALPSLYDALEAIDRAYLYEGNSNVKNALFEVRDSIKTGNDAFELLRSKEAFAHWRFDSLVQAQTSAQNVFSQFITDLEQRIEPALREALIRSEINPVTGKPVNLLSELVTRANASLPEIELGDFEGFLYFQADLSVGIDSASGKRPLLGQLEGLFSTAAVRGAGNNLKEDAAVKFYNNGQLLRFSDGELVQSVDDERITPELQTALISAVEVAPTRSVSVLSDVLLKSTIAAMLDRNTFLERFKLGGAQSSENALASSDFLLDVIASNQAIYAESLSGASLAFDEDLFASSLILTQESLFESSLQPDAVNARFANEFVASFLDRVSEETGVSLEEALALLADDILDREIDGKRFDELLLSAEQQQKISSLIKTSPSALKVLDTQVPLTNVFSLVRREADNAFTEVEREDINVVASNFSFGVVNGGVDSDNDGVLDNSDAFPFDASRSDPEFPTDYEGLFSKNFSGVGELTAGLAGEVSLDVALEQTNLQCSTAPCLSIGDLATPVTDTWVVIERPVGASVTINEPNDSTEVGFEFIASTPGSYQLLGTFTTAEVPERTITQTLSITVPDFEDFNYRTVPENPSLGDQISVEIQVTEVICDAYNFCGPYTVGDYAPISDLNGDVFSAWLHGDNQGALAIENGSDNLALAAYGETLNLVVTTKNDARVLSVLAINVGVNDDLDGDGVVDLFDYVPGDAACSSKADAFSYNDAYEKNIIGEDPGVSAALPDVRYCRDTFKSQKGLTTPYADFPELNVEIYYDNSLSILLIEDSQTAETVIFSIPFVRENNRTREREVLREVLSDEFSNQVYIGYESGRIDVLSLATDKIVPFAELVEGYTLDSLLWVNSDFVFVEYAPIIGSGNIFRAYDKNGNTQMLGLGTDFLLPGQRVDVFVGEDSLANIDDFDVDWSVQRIVTEDVMGTVVDQVKNITPLSLVNGGRSLAEGQVQIGDLVHATLKNSSGVVLGNLSVPVLTVSSLQFEEQFVNPGDAIEFALPELLEPLGDILRVNWLVNSDTEDFFKYKFGSIRPPYLFPPNVSSFGDIIKAEILFELDDEANDANDIKLPIHEIVVAAIGNPRDIIPVLDGVAIVTDNRIQATLDTTPTANAQFLDFFFSPRWLIDGVVVEVEGQPYTEQSIDVTLPYGTTLQVVYAYDLSGETGLTSTVQVGEPVLDLNTSQVEFDETYFELNSLLTISDSYNQVFFENYVPVWRVNDEIQLDSQNSSFQILDQQVGDTISLELAEIDTTKPGTIGDNRVLDTAEIVVGYGFDLDTDGDFDGDGVKNSQDYFIYDASCSAPGQGNPDDFDSDGVANLDELNVGAATVLSLISDIDSDGDGLTDREEFALGTNPRLSDTDGDGDSDLYEARLRGTDPLDNLSFTDLVALNDTDTDQDGILDSDERAHGTNIAIADTDRDGLQDGYEVLLGTDPAKLDTDDDFLSDGAEILITKTLAVGLGSKDSDSDGVEDGFEVEQGFNPNSDDSNNDSITDDNDLSTSGVASKVIVRADLADYMFDEERTVVPAGTCFASYLFDKGSELIAFSENPQTVGSDVKVALAGANLEEVYIYDGASQSFLSPVSSLLMGGTVTSLAFADGNQSFDTLYVGFDNGLVRQYDLSGTEPTFTQAFDAPLDGAITSVRDQGTYLLIETEVSADNYSLGLYNKGTTAFVSALSTNVSIAQAVWDDPATKLKLWVLSEDDRAIFTAYDFSTVPPTQIPEGDLNNGIYELEGPVFIDQSLTERAIRFASGEAYIPDGAPRFDSSTSANALSFKVAIQNDDAEPQTALISAQDELIIQVYPDAANASEFWRFRQDAFATDVAAIGLVQEDVLLIEPDASIVSPSGGSLSFSRLDFGDSDGDGLPGWYEGVTGLDDTLAADATAVTTQLGGQTRLAIYDNFVDISAYLFDSDGDGLSDGFEADNIDALAVGVVDRDGDGLTDKQENDLADLANFDPANANSNSDMMNILDGAEDPDGDGLTNIEELSIYGTNFNDADTDSDNVGDYFELFVLRTDPTQASTFDFDLDGVPDHDGNSDFDSDGLSNSEEEIHGTSPYDPDTDGDGLSDFEEVDGAATALLALYLSNPLLADTDGDGNGDLLEVRAGFDPQVEDGNGDGDLDGLTDIEEALYGSDPTLVDTDSDTVSDFEEIFSDVGYSTSPIDPDTDDDSLSDADERNGYDPMQDVATCEGAVTPLGLIMTRGDLSDTDGDGLSDSVEFNLAGLPRTFYSNPLVADTDGDGLSDFDEYEYEYEYSLEDLQDYGFDPAAPPATLISALLCDTDSDGLTDGEEDGLGSNAAFGDTDNDLLSDFDESERGLSLTSFDSDGDTLRDGYEVFLTLTNPKSKDSDRNNVSDALEDPDGDGLSNFAELERTFTLPLESDTGGLINAAGKLQSDFSTSDGIKTRVWINDLSDIVFNGSVDGGGNILDNLGAPTAFINNFVFIASANALNDAGEDPDADGLTNAEEIALGTNPWSQDSDSDGLTDAAEVNGDLSNQSCPDGSGGTTACTSDPNNADTDGDQLLDGQESVQGTDPRNEDTDQDGLTDGEEVNSTGTDPLNADTDNDLLPDGTDPHPNSIDGDSDDLLDLAEHLLGLSQISVDSDSDSIPDSQEVWVFGYKSDGSLLTIGPDVDMNDVPDFNFDTRDSTPGWAPFERPDFHNPPYREVIENPIPGSELARAYIWYVSDPRVEDADNDGLSDSDELLLIENDSSGGTLDLDAPIDLTSDASFNALKTEDRFTVSNPFKVNTDGMGPTDGDEDYDNDYASNAIEASNDDISIINPDSDEESSGTPPVFTSDGLLDGIEALILGTRGDEQDTDGDNIFDGAELAVSFVDPSAANASSNPRTVALTERCLASERPLTVGGQKYCFTVLYNSLPTLGDSDTDGVNDSTDAYPLDRACSVLQDGFDRLDRRRCYLSWAAEQADSGKVAHLFDATYERVALYHPNWDSVIRYDYNAKSFEEDLDLGTDTTDFVVYEGVSETLYLINVDGTLRSQSLGGGFLNNETALPVVNSIEAAYAVNNHILVQEGTGAGAELVLYDLSSAEIDRLALPNAQLEYAVWASDTQRLYLPTAVNGLLEDLAYIDLETGLPGSNGFTSAATFAGDDFNAAPLSYLSLDDTRASRRVIVPSGFVLDDSFASAAATIDIILGRFVEPSAQRMLLVDSAIAGRTTEDYVVSSYFDESELGLESSTEAQNSLQIYVEQNITDLDAMPPVVAATAGNAFEYTTSDINGGIWGLIQDASDIVQVRSTSEQVFIESVGLTDGDTDTIPCFYARRYDLNDDPACGDVTANTGTSPFEDPDQDELVNTEEYDYLTNPRSADSDSDGWDDFDEIIESTDPNDPADF